MRNVFKGKNLTHLLYGILMLLPFCSIFARVIYVQSNQNAKDSYYGETINSITNVSVSYNELITNNTYYVHNYYYELPDNLGNITMYISYFKNVSTGVEYDINIYNKLRFYRGNSTTVYTQLISSDGVSSALTFSANDIFEFTYLSTININTIVNYLNIYYVVYNEYAYMDNVFDYSINSFVDNHNFNVDFFGWFNNLFLHQTGSNMVYINFINWYLNYALLVSSGYILFLLFLWFINFARKLLEGGNSFGHGGF